MKSRSTGFWLLVALGSVFAGCIVFPLIASALSTLALALALSDCSPSDADNPIEDMAHFTLPPSATNLDSGCVGMQGSIGWARFDMAPEDLNAFVATTDVGNVTEQPIPKDVSFHYDVWNLGEYLYAEYREDYFEQYIVIDTSDPSIYTVYVQVLVSN